MGRIFNLLFNRYSNCTVLLRIGTLNIKPVGVCRIKGFVKKQLRMFYWAWHNKLKNAVIYLIRQTSREKCKLFSWSVRDLIMMKVPATKTVKTFIHKNKYVNVKNGIGTKEFNNCDTCKCYIYWKQHELYFLNFILLQNLLNIYMLATFNIFMIYKTDINQFTCFYKNIFFNMYIQQSNLYRTTIM